MTDIKPSLPLGLNPLGDDLVLNCEEKPPKLFVVPLMELIGAPPYPEPFELYFVKSIDGCSWNECCVAFPLPLITTRVVAGAVSTLPNGVGLGEMPRPEFMISVGLATGLTFSLSYLSIITVKCNLNDYFIFANIIT